MASSAEEVQAGFKMTELGPLPAEWSANKLDVYLKEKKDKNRSATKLPVYTVSNIHGFILSDDFFDKQVYSRDLKTYKIVSYYDFAYNPYRINVGSLGLLGVKSIGLVSPAYVVFGIDKPSLLHAKYLKYILKSDEYINKIMRLSMSRGSVRKSVAYSDLAKIVIPCPPIAEQRTITQVLSTIQSAIEAQSSVISAARQLKKSLTRHLFTYGPIPRGEIDQVPLKETEMESIPEYWAAVDLGSVTIATQYGLSLVGKPSGQYPILRMNNIDGGKINRHNLQYVDLEQAIFAKFKLNVGDLLFNRTNSYELVGKTAIYDLPEACVFASYLIRVIADTAVLIPSFLNHYLNTDFAQSRLKGLATRAVGQSNISASKLKMFMLPVPPLQEQEEIAAALYSLDTKIEAEENRQAALQVLFKTMIHLLMTGQLRVNNLKVDD